MLNFCKTANMEGASETTGKGFETRSIQVGQECDQWGHLEMVPPIVNTMTFYQKDPVNIDEHYNYSRLNNPTRQVLERCLAALDNGEHALVYPSGSAAIYAVLHLLKPGDHFISCLEQYGGTRMLFEDYAEAQAMTVDFVDTTEIQNVEAAIKSNTKMIFIETPSNPCSKVSDIVAISKLAHSREGAEIIVAIDNTLLTPYFQRPLELGADVAVYSMTKYMNGHNDVLAGSIVVNDTKTYETLKTNQICSGSILSPFDCFLVNRSLKTLALRMEKHCSNGLAVAKFLEAHPKVVKVFHPMMPSHPQHELAKKQSSGHSGLLSFQISGTVNEAKKFIQNLQVFLSTVSIGSFASFVMIPTSITHKNIPVELREQLGIFDTTIRLSVGLESTEDLIHDLDQALQKAYIEE